MFEAPTVKIYSLKVAKESSRKKKIPVKYKKFDICLNHNILLSSRKHDFIWECLYIYIYIYIYIYVWISYLQTNITKNYNHQMP